jgi:DNA-directed RNA polymerase subunit RPC12/RpoP
MPIRFRCAYCNQLMGISQRKVGTIVRCPKCSGQVVVPHSEETPEPERLAPPEANRDAIRALEDPELEALLAGAAKEAAGLPKSKRKPAPPPMIEIDVEPIELPAASNVPPTHGSAAPIAAPPSVPPESAPHLRSLSNPFIVSRPVALSIAALTLALVGLSFAIGFLVGKWSSAGG